MKFITPQIINYACIFILDDQSYKNVIVYMLNKSQELKK